jgi:hypothetical protein
MGKVVFLESFKKQKAAQRGFREWRSRFKSLPFLDEHTRWSDLPDELILFLAEDDLEGRQIIHDLLMGALALGNGYEFESLSPEKLMPLLDIYFLLLDQIRFECMRRIGWVEEIPQGERSIIELINEYGRTINPALIDPPRLTEAHPSYPEYARLPELDQKVFVRKTIPAAISLFREKTIN